MAHSLLPPNSPALHLFSPPGSCTLCVALPYRLVVISTFSHRNRVSVVQASHSFSDDGAQPSQGDVKGRNSNILSAQSFLPLPNTPIWVRWALGFILLLAIPFHKKILRFEDKVEKAAITVVEAIEQTAETAEKISSDVANALPNNIILKRVAKKVENMADDIGDTAQLAGTILRVVDKITDEVQRLVDPTAEKGELMAKESQEEKVTGPSAGEGKK